MFQRMIENKITKEQPAHISHKDMENPKFQMMLTQNHYTNPESLNICFPIKIKKAANVNKNIDDDMIPVNFFTNWIKEINITKYGSDK